MYTNIHKSYMQMKAEELQLAHLGYVFTDREYNRSEISERRLKAIQNRFNSSQGIKPQSPNDRLTVKERCSQAIKSEFKQWSTFKRYLDTVLEMSVINGHQERSRISISDRDAPYIREFVRILKRTEKLDVIDNLWEMAYKVGKLTSKSEALFNAHESKENPDTNEFDRVAYARKHNKLLSRYHKNDAVLQSILRCLVLLGEIKEKK